QVCNASREVAALKAKPYYSEGINSGGSGRLYWGRTSSTCGTTASAGSCSNCHIEENVKAAGDRTESFVVDLIQRVATAHSLHVRELEANTLDTPELLDSLSRASYGSGAEDTRKRRHLVQQASLVGHMARRGLVGNGKENSYSFVEMGAGRGGLGLAVATAFPGVDLTVVERSSVRRKVRQKSCHF
ncbi:unnamed protein product, partial [Choristocarpus tenellus]